MRDRLAQYREDLALRNSARAVLMADIEHVRVSLSGKGMAKRVAGRIGDGALDVFEVAKTQADDKRGIIAILIGAIVLWLARSPILEMLGLDGLETDEDQQLDEEIENPAQASATDNDVPVTNEHDKITDPMQTNSDPDGGDDNEHANN